MNGTLENCLNASESNSENFKEGVKMNECLKLQTAANSLKDFLANEGKFLEKELSKRGITNVTAESLVGQSPVSYDCFERFMVCSHALPKESDFKDKISINVTIKLAKELYVMFEFLIEILTDFANKSYEYTAYTNSHLYVFHSFLEWVYTYMRYGAFSDEIRTSVDCIQGSILGYMRAQKN